jgi:hypothetical protein
MSATVPDTAKYLGIYLNDHLMGSTTGIELVQRIAKENEGNELGRFCTELARDIDADRDTLLAIMDQLGVATDKPKVAIGWATEKVGRLKPNGQLRGYSPLAPLVELEGLSLGIEGKRALWVALAESESVARRVGAERLQELITRAERQREGVERHRRDAARRALAG